MLNSWGHVTHLVIYFRKLSLLMGENWTCQIWNARLGDPRPFASNQVMAWSQGQSSETHSRQAVREDAWISKENTTGLSPCGQLAMGLLLPPMWSVPHWLRGFSHPALSLTVGKQRLGLACQKNNNVPTAWSKMNSAGESGHSPPFPMAGRGAYPSIHLKSGTETDFQFKCFSRKRPFWGKSSKFSEAKGMLPHPHRVLTRCFHNCNKITF